MADQQDFKTYPDYELEVALVKVLLFNIKQHIAARKPFQIEKYFVAPSTLYDILGKQAGLIDLDKINQSSPKYLRNTFNIIPFEISSELLSKDYLQELLFKGSPDTQKDLTFISFFNDGKLLLFVEYFDVINISLFEKIGIPPSHQNKIKVAIANESYFLPFFLETEYLFQLYHHLAKFFTTTALRIEAYKHCVAQYIVNHVFSDDPADSEGQAFLAKHWDAATMPRLSVTDVHQFRLDRRDIAHLYFEPFYQDFLKNKTSITDHSRLDTVVSLLSDVRQEDEQLFFQTLEVVHSMLGVEELDFGRILYFSRKNRGQYEKA